MAVDGRPKVELSSLSARVDVASSRNVSAFNCPRSDSLNINGGYSIEVEPADAADACGIFSLGATGVRSNRLVEKPEKFTLPKVAACWSGK